MSDHKPGNLPAIRNTSSALPLSILTDRPATQAPRLPVAGKVRPGIKVLTAGAKQLPGAEALYMEGYKSGRSFDDIEKDIKKAHPNYGKSPMTPRNTGFFRVTRDDFVNPEAAATLLDLYGETRDPRIGRAIYTFPVIFHSNDVNQVLEQKFAMYNSVELVHWSEYGEDGTRYCMQKKAMAVANRRKTFGMRPTERRQVCDPNACPNFDSGKCMFNATLRFYVPGVPGVGLIEMPFTSIYGAVSILNAMEIVQAGLGRIDGTYRNQPIFWLSKVQQEVSRNTLEGTQRALQWIIKMDAKAIQMDQVFRERDAMTLALGAPVEAPVTDGLRHAPMTRAELPSPVAAPVAAAPEPMRAVGNDNPYMGAVPERTIEGEVLRQDFTPTATDFAPSQASLDALYAKAGQLGFTNNEFAGMAHSLFGENWQRNVDAVNTLDMELDNTARTGDAEYWKNAGIPF